MSGPVAVALPADLPDPVSGSLAQLELYAARYVAAIQTRNYAAAQGHAMLLQAVALRLQDWARLAGYHHDPKQDTYTPPAPLGPREAARRESVPPTDAEVGTGEGPCAAGAFSQRGARHDADR